MSGLDIVIAVVVLIGLWRGFQVGLIKTAPRLLGWFVALVVATRLASSIAPQLIGIVENPVFTNSLGVFVSGDCCIGCHASSGICIIGRAEFLTT